MKDLLITATVLGTLLSVIAATLHWSYAYGCSSRWEGSGYTTQYGLIKGCTVSKDKMHYLPEKNVREF